MDGSSPIAVLFCEWVSYLWDRGHRLRRPSAFGYILLSRNGRGRRFRWLFLHSKKPWIRLTSIDREAINHQMDLARKAREKAYLVVKFEHPEPKLLILPARTAMKAGRLHSDKGGIPWD